MFIIIVSMRIMGVSETKTFKIKELRSHNLLLGAARPARDRYLLGAMLRSAIIGEDWKAAQPVSVLRCGLLWLVIISNHN